MTTYMSSIQDFIENALKDPTLAASIDIDKLLETSQDSGFIGRSLEMVTKEIVVVLEELSLDEKVVEFSGKLLGYQYIARVCDIRLGRFIRWIKRGTTILHRGGILSSIDVKDSGIVLLCRNVKNGFFRLKYEDCILFQQLSLEEKMILSLETSL